MSKAKHTPGPWFIWKEQAGIDAEDLLDESTHDVLAGEPAELSPSVVSGVTRIVEVEAGDCCEHKPATALANARLIAAAPDLLAAAKAVVAVVDRKTDAVDQLKAAIAKAEGQS